ncbi:hypothetical protein M514_14980 [Trichuris suis]|uniref:DDE-1 domain-containing protein n=1 Tax=Trichuris suis TaxID=68888 RepID=A0A085NUD0_9BILA|nr:hypothetical protein M514_14980 [Trichuris suis]
MELKVLLLLDNAGEHHADMHSKGVQIQLLPPNTTFFIQPMDQGVIHAFKALYTKISLQRLVSAIDADENFTLKGVPIRHPKCSEGDEKETLNTRWKKHWPDCVHDYEGFSPDEVQHATVDEVMALAKLLGGEGFGAISEEQVSTLIDAHCEPLTDADVANDRFLSLMYVSARVKGFATADLAELTKSESEEDEEAELEADTE